MHARHKVNEKSTWWRSGACCDHSTAMAMRKKLGIWRSELWRGCEGCGTSLAWTSLPELAQGHVLLCVFLHNLGHRHLKVLLCNVYPSLAKGKHSSFCADRLNKNEMEGKRFESLCISGKCIKQIEKLKHTAMDWWTIRSHGFEVSHKHVCHPQLELNVS